MFMVSVVGRTMVVAQSNCSRVVVGGGRIVVRGSFNHSFIKQQGRQTSDMLQSVQ